MKRYILIAVSVLISVVAMAAPPKLNVEKLFDGSYNSDKSVSIMINKTKKEFYRGITVTKNPELVRKVTALFKKDAENADESRDIIDNGMVTYSSLIIENNKHKINVGVSYSPDNTCYLFISGNREAFE